MMTSREIKMYVVSGLAASTALLLFFIGAKLNFTYQGGVLIGLSMALAGSLILILLFPKSIKQSKR
jgi:hypothetical protein